jgi:hypothetical protein
MTTHVVERVLEVAALGRAQHRHGLVVGQRLDVGRDDDLGFRAVLLLDDGGRVLDRVRLGAARLGGLDDGVGVLDVLLLVWLVGWFGNGLF